ncbi:ATP-binding protein [Capnocytophaga granulosa]
MNEKDIRQLHNLLHELTHLPQESEWIEFKVNNKDPQVIGENISAMANSAAIADRLSAYIIWGVEDGTHNIVGSNFHPSSTKHNQQELESWLLQKLEPKIDFKFYEFDYQDKSIVILEIRPTRFKPVKFDGIEYIRVGSYTKKLQVFPEKERELWRSLERIPFERQIAMRLVEGERVLQLLDFSKYFDMTQQPLPQDQQGILQKLSDEQLITPNDNKWDITNLGAILFAKRLSNFDFLGRKGLRMIRYEGNNKFTTLKEIESVAGYAVDFEFIISSIKALLPSYEEIGLAFRKEINTYPDIALRELVANALIHQDFNITGTSPMVEIFSHRIEITNAGSPLVEVSRFMDKPPRSRNEILAKLMRRMDICEERGTGIDKVISQIERKQMPAPLFEDLGDYTRVTLFTYKEFNTITKEERLRACYWHCVFKYTIHEQMNNASLRERFGNSVSGQMISKIIKEAQEKKLIKVFDEEAGTKAMKYIPSWA